MSVALPPIKGFIPSSFIEWEGKISCALFLPGCNFRCPFCHAGDLVLRPETLETISFDAVVRHLVDSKGWIDGVVISGGEPTLHPGLRPFIEALLEHVPAIRIDTNGTRPDILETLIGDGLIHCVGMDIKAPVGDAYHRAAGGEVDLDAIAASIDLLREGGIRYEFRTTVVPGLHDGDAITAIAQMLGPGETLILQQFAPLNCLDAAFLDARPYSRQQLREMADAARPHLADCRLRGEPRAAAAGEGGR